MENPKILAIDDLMDNLIVLNALLDETFPTAKIITAQSGASGIKICLSEKPDVVILDIIMPGMDGFEVCKFLKSNPETRIIPVIMLTASKTNPEFRTKALEAGADAFLNKPINESELTAQIRAMLRIKEAEDQKKEEKERLKMLVQERTLAFQNELNERIQTEKALKESEAQFREFFEKAADAIFIADIETGIILDVNYAATRMMKLDYDQLVGIHQSKLHPPVRENFTQDAFDKHKKLVKEKIDSHPIINSVISADGSETPVEILASEISFKGKPSMMGTFRDITERKKAENELQQSQSTLRGILESFPGELFWKDVDLNYLGCNKAFCVSAKLPDSNYIIGKNDFELPWADTGAELYRSMDREVISTGIPFHNLIASQIGPDGKLQWLNTSKLPLTNCEGKIIGILGVSQDITAFKLAEESLMESLQMNDSLLHTIPFGMNIVDEFGTLLFQNKQLEALFGTTAIGGRCWELYRDDHSQCEECPLRSGIQLGRTDLIETNNVIGGKILQISHTGMMFQGKKAMLEIFQDVTEKRKAESELMEINQRFSNLVETTDGIVWEADAETFVYKFVSKNAERILGYPETDWYQPNFWSAHIYPEDQEKTVLYCQAQTSLKMDHDFEYRFVTSDGRILWMADYVKVILRDGKPWKLNGLMVDITERKKTELALHDSENRYRSFISQVSEGVYRLECDMPIDISLPVEEQIDLIYDHAFIAECNDSFLNMYKITDPNEIIGKGHLDFHGGRHHPVNRQTLRNFVTNGYRVENANTEEVDHDGNVLIISNNSLGIIESNHLVRMWGTQTDVTEKIKGAQLQQLLLEISNAALSSIDLHDLIELICRGIEKLIDSKNFYIAFYDEKTNMLSTVYERDEKEAFTNWSAEKSLTGYVIRNKKSMIIREEDANRLMAENEIEQIGTPSKVWLGVPLMVKKKVIGAIVVQNYENKDAYTEKDKLMLEFISNQVSVSIERKRNEQEIMNALAKAEESDQLKSAFLANMSHEIRTPLNSIIGFSELITDPAFEPEQQLEFAHMINESGTNLLTILTDIMDISKIEAGQVEVKQVKFSLRRLLSDIQREYSYKARQKGIELQLNIQDSDHELFIESDETKLRQVLINLVGNAIKFTSEGFVEIGLTTISNYYRVYVKDTGIGIPEEYHEKIFERFRQVETAHTRKYGGNGLGLAISKSLIEMVGGTLGLESVQGKGSTFYFVVPGSSQFNEEK